MNKDFFIALGITALVYVGYSYFFPQNQHPIPQQETAAVEEQASSPAPKIKVKTSVKEKKKTRLKKMNVFILFP